MAAGKNFYYTAGRVVSVANRPLFLFLANQFLQSDVVKNIAVVFLASTLGMVISSADNHRAFYIKYFDRDGANVNPYFFTFLTGFLVLCTGGAFFVLVMNLKFTSSIALAVAAVLFFLSEKLADEVQRFRLFEKNIRQWGISAILRFCLQFAGTGALMLVFGRDLPVWYCILTLALANSAVFLPQLPRTMRTYFGRFTAPFLSWLTQRAIRHLFTNWQIWGLVLLSAGVGYLDRIFALVLDKDVLPLFMILAMCFSVVQLLMDFYFISRHRRDFLEQKISVITALKSKEFASVMLAGIVISSIACAIVLRISKGGAMFPLQYVVIIGLLQTLFALNMIPYQILYWKNYTRGMLFIEISFWGMVAFICLIFRIFDLGPLQFFYLVVTLVGFRFLAYFIISVKDERTGSAGVGID